MPSPSPLPLSVHSILTLSSCFSFVHFLLIFLSFFFIQITQSLSWFQSIPVLSVKEELDFVLSTTRRELSFKTSMRIPVTSFLTWQNDFESGWPSLSEEPLGSCHDDTTLAPQKPPLLLAGGHATVLLVLVQIKSMTVKEPHISLDPAHTSRL